MIWGGAGNIDNMGEVQLRQIIWAVKQNNCLEKGKSWVDKISVLMSNTQWNVFILDPDFILLLKGYMENNSPH